MVGRFRTFGCNLGVRSRCRWPKQAAGTHPSSQAPVGLRLASGRPCPSKCMGREGTWVGRLFHLGGALCFYGCMEYKEGTDSMVLADVWQ